MVISMDISTELESGKIMFHRCNTIKSQLIIANTAHYNGKKVEINDINPK